MKKLYHIPHTTYHIPNRGFTLVELMVVITIIGILAGFGFTNYTTSQKRARDGKRKADLEQIRSALEMYRTDNGSYPTGGWYISTSGGSWIPGLAPDYIASVPVDPLNTGGWPWGEGNTYAYYSGPWCIGLSGVEYILAARLEFPKTQGVQYGTCSWSYANVYAVGSP